VIYIAHRGNLDGPNPDKENHPDYIHAAVQQGYAAEVDLWRVEDNFFLGHDSPQYRINEKYLDLLASSGVLWTHIKNVEAFDYLVSHNKQQWNFFWHQEDDYALTSLGHIWAYPGKKLTNNAICVLPEHTKRAILEISKCKGVCTDYVYKFEKELNEFQQQ
tara:strand:+ start:402 stop:884 length:483 start_codon:yes stop_codon:yes gene_type:complete